MHHAPSRAASSISNRSAWASQIVHSAGNTRRGGWPRSRHLRRIFGVRRSGTQFATAPVVNPLSLLGALVLPVVLGAPPAPALVAPTSHAHVAPPPVNAPISAAKPAPVKVAAHAHASSASAASEIAAEVPPARAARWLRLAKDIHPNRWWSPRVNIGSGEVTDPVRMSGTTSSDLYHNHAVDHPVMRRFTFAETWKGSLRFTRAISLLVRDRASEKVVAEIVTWDDDDTRLVTPTETRTFKTRHEALQAFFEAQPGFAEAKRDAQQHASPVTFEYYSLQHHGTTTARAGVLRPSLEDPKTLVYQLAWGGQGADSPVQRLDLAKLPEGPVRLAPGHVLAVPGRAWLPEENRYNPKPLLTMVGRAPAPNSKEWPELTLFKLPERSDGKSFEVFIRGEDGQTRTIKVEPAS